MSRVALFDLDRTLLDVNSGRLWVQAEWRAGRLRIRDAAWAAWWLSRYSLGFGEGLEQVFEVAVRSVANSPESLLEARVVDWFEREVRHHLRPGGRDALRAHRDAGDRLVLATSGTQYAARAAARAYGIDEVVCTEIEAVDGVLTGRIATLAVGDAKATACECWAAGQGVDLSQAVFYTDSATDIALMERVAEPVAVNPDRALRREALRRGWPIVDWGAAA